MKTTVLLLAVLSWPILGAAEEPERRSLAIETEKSTQEAERTAERLRERIHEEIEILGKHAWAGEYYEGDGLGTNVYLSLAPKAGYVYEWHGCRGLYDRNYGTIEEKGDRLRLSFTLKRQELGQMEIAEELVPIAWGERTYLVPAKGIVGFCNQINRGWDPRKEVHAFALLRAGDEHKPVTGHPVVPKAFESYLLSKPIETEIVGVGRPKTTAGGGDARKVTITVTLKHGSKAGLLPGMKLHVIKPFGVSDSIELTKVEEQQSEGVITRYYTIYNVKGVSGLLPLPDRNPKIGWELSTRDR